MEERLVILESKYVHSQQIVEQLQEKQQCRIKVQYMQDCLEICRQKFIDTFESNILNNVCLVNSGGYLSGRERLILRKTLLEDFQDIQQEMKNVCLRLTEEDYVYCFFLM